MNFLNNYLIIGSLCAIWRDQPHSYDSPMIFFAISVFIVLLVMDHFIKLEKNYWFRLFYFLSLITFVFFFGKNLYCLIFDSLIFGSLSHRLENIKSVGIKDDIKSILKVIFNWYIWVIFITLIALIFFIFISKFIYTTFFTINIVMEAFNYHLDWYAILKILLDKIYMFIVIVLNWVIKLSWYILNVLSFVHQYLNKIK